MRSPSKHSCFVCLESSVNEDWLFKVCECTYAHKRCVLTWIEENSTRCKVCGKTYMSDVPFDEYIRSRRDLHRLINKPPVSAGADECVCEARACACARSCLKL